MSRVRISGAGGRKNVEPYSSNGFQMCLESGLTELFVTGDREFQTTGCDTQK